METLQREHADERLCIVDGCGSAWHARGLCFTHYQRDRNGIDPDGLFAITCVGCGASFRSPRRHAKYCSERCRNTARPTRMSKYRPQSWRRPVKPCKVEGCDKTDNCGRAVCQMHRNRMKKYGTYERAETCATCGVSFDPTHQFRCGPYYCESCRRERENEAMAKRIRGLFKRCRVCGDWTAVQRGHCPRITRTGRPSKSPDYVPVPATARTCLVCGIEFMAIGRRTVCSKACARNAPATRACKALRKARLRGASNVERVVPATVFDRDGWRCQLCGKAVKRKARVPDYMAPTVDHIVPLVDGGDHTYANCQTAHFICNSRRGASGCVQLRWT